MYNMACFYSINGDSLKSLEALQGLLTPIRELLDIYDFSNDPDFAKLKSDEKFGLFYEILYGRIDAWRSHDPPRN